MYEHIFQFHYSPVLPVLLYFSSKVLSFLKLYLVVIRNRIASRINFASVGSAKGFHTDLYLFSFDFISSSTVALCFIFSSTGADLPFGYEFGY